MSRGWMGAALAAMLPVLALPATAYAQPARTAGVSVYLTDLGTQAYLARQPAVSWSSGPAGADPTITVDTTRRYQEITGFGASFTDSSAWLVGTKLDAAQRDAVMRD